MINTDKLADKIKKTSVELGIDVKQVEQTPRAVMSAAVKANKKLDEPARDQKEGVNIAKESLKINKASFAVAVLALIVGLLAIICSYFC